jgi:hypothetical protein
MPSDAGSTLSPVEIAGLVVAALVLLCLLVVWWKGRRFSTGDVFRASRLTAGNRLFPTQVLITPTSVVHHTPQWIGHREHSIHIAHVASVSVDTSLLFSTVYIETSGGTAPIACRGHRKRDAVRMKQLIETYQTAYYRPGERRAEVDVAGAPGPPASPR